MFLNDTSPIVFSSQVFEANKPQKSGRIYPRHVLEQNIKRLEEGIKGCGLFGEMGTCRDSIMHFANASHRITRIWWEGDKVFAEAQILNTTPMGKILKSLLDERGTIKLSPRGIGNVIANDGVFVVGDSYKLITFDVVDEDENL
jgi:hypothetical protein